MQLRDLDERYDRGEQHRPSAGLIAALLIGALLVLIIVAASGGSAW